MRLTSFANARNFFSFKRSFSAACLFLASLGLTSASAIADDQTVGNGGGYSETLVLTALRGFAKTVSMCAAQAQICGLQVQEQSALSNVLPYVSKLLTQDGGAVFLSESAAPEKFPAGAGVKFFVVPDSWPSLFFNRTLLYLPSGTGVAFPISLAEAYGVVTAALLSGWGGMNSNEAFGLGTRLGSLASQNQTSLEIGKNSHAVRISDPLKRPRLLSLQFDTFSNEGFFSSFTLNDGTNDFDLSPTLQQALRCPTAEGTLPQIAQRIELSDINLLHLVRTGVRLRAEIKLTGRYVCSGDPALLLELPGILTLEFQELIVSNPFDPDDRAYRFIPASFKFEQENLL